MKGYKNRTHKIKRVISPNKFHRIFNNNLDKIGIATIFRGYDEGFANSLQAVKVGDIVYALMPCRKQKANRLETYAVRYKVTDPLDFIMFQPFPSKIVSDKLEVDF